MIIFSPVIGLTEPLKSSQSDHLPLEQKFVVASGESTKQH